MRFVGSGFSLMRENTASVAAGALAAGDVSIAGFGRMALAYPGFANALVNGTLDAKRLCTVCGNCYKLLRALEPTGCPTRDQETYLPLLRQVLNR
jgi:2,4-dienoyl-CoA reductase-like NADH-dependent reductase (Old Yellow Enzyme family)